MPVSTARLAIRHAESPAPVAPYVPRRHPGVRGTWDRAAIVGALRDWTTQTGGPPRRQDWTGERSPVGSNAQRKWMAEHPRWPSSSCVAGHFGSWSAALEAAGLPARRLTFETSVAERVDAARRMAAGGVAIWAIAQALEVSVSSVNNYLRARPCPACGGPVTSRRAERCSACTAHEPTIARAWTRDGVRAAIRDWQAEHGRAPSYRDWTPSRTRPKRWEAESPRWPSAAVVSDLYADCHDPWNAALEEAGAEVRFRRWSDDAVRTALASFWAHTGRAPTRADVVDPTWQGPCAETLRRRYGGVAAAWSALGPVPQETGPG